MVIGVDVGALEVDASAFSELEVDGSSGFVGSLKSKTSSAFMATFRAVVVDDQGVYFT